jgi:hypothetical protein
MSEQDQGPSPNGVMHGPYPKTDAHPWDQSIGHHNAINEAFEAERISEQSAIDLQGNMEPVDTDALNEELDLEEQAHLDLESGSSEKGDVEYEDEDPLEGDVDRLVDPDETRTDEQIAHDEKYKVEPY